MASKWARRSRPSACLGGYCRASFGRSQRSGFLSGVSSPPRARADRDRCTHHERSLKRMAGLHARVTVNPAGRNLARTTTSHRLMNSGAGDRSISAKSWR